MSSLPQKEPATKHGAGMGATNGLTEYNLKALAAQQGLAKADPGMVNVRCSALSLSQCGADNTSLSYTEEALPCNSGKETGLIGCHTISAMVGSGSELDDWQRK